MDNIHTVYDMLNWENHPETRSEGIRMAKEITDLSMLIQPPDTPSVWECCAQILSEKSDSELEPYLNKLIEWLQDLNWPGALIISDRLKLFSGKKLITPFLNCVNRAINQNNEEGLMWLDYLSELLDNEELKAELPKTILKKLQKHYQNWGAWHIC